MIESTSFQSISIYLTLNTPIDFAFSARLTFEFFEPYYLGFKGFWLPAYYFGSNRDRA